MDKKIVAKKMMDKERDPAKLKEVLIAKGHTSGKTPAGHHAHHKIPVAEGGKTTVKNIVVIPKKQHIAIHKSNRAKGRI